MDLPSDYVASAGHALGAHGEAADAYLRHTRIGDPMADAVIDAIARMPGPEGGRAMQRLLDGHLHPGDPPELQRFLDEAEREPAWLDRDAMLRGCRLFHQNSEMFLAAFVGSVLIEGFCTYISKSFVITGRLVDQGVKRLKQNNRHLMEIFLPGGMEREGDGWKLSVRIRLVHAKIRRLLHESDDWDEAAWGTPISAAHMSYAASMFSGTLLKRARALGVRPSPEDRHGFMQVWRYSALLMGVPEPLLPVDEAAAQRMAAVGRACEPPVCLESRILAQGLVNSAPVFVGKSAPEERRKLARHIYGISRALIGNELADQLGYPKVNTIGVLPMIRLKNTLNAALGRIVPGLRRRSQANQFASLIGLSYYDDAGINLSMPTHVHAEHDRTF